jgi:hypothetical protein
MNNEEEPNLNLNPDDIAKIDTLAEELGLTPQGIMSAVRQNMTDETGTPGMYLSDGTFHPFIS